MEHAACNVIYVNWRAKDQVIQRGSNAGAVSVTLPNGSDSTDSKLDAEINSSIESILSAFTTVRIFSSGSSCLAKISDLDNAARDNAPTLVLIDISNDEEQRVKRISREIKLPSPTLPRRQTGEIESSDIYGLRLLSHIVSEIQVKKLSKLIIPIAVISGFERSEANSISTSPNILGSQGLDEGGRLLRFMDAGAVDVLVSPVSKERAQGLVVQAYRIFKEATKSDGLFLVSKRSRKMSWVGVEEEKPFAYLRESMVSNLMSGICSPETNLTSDLSDIINNGNGQPYSEWDKSLSIDQKSVAAEAVGSWTFSAHSFSDDELLYCALLMLQHALSAPELEHWRLTPDELFIYLQACRVSYNNFVHYHNFRHVVDVLQAVFHFLVQLGTLPPYPKITLQQSRTAAILASILKPFDALVLLVSAVGHDVGHPGVNNAFLVSLNAPLAQLYNDRSVLESFHCAAYSQILRRHWPSVFKDTNMRRLMINIILATDMGLHFKYMGDLSKLQEVLSKDSQAMKTWNDKSQEENRDLLCGLLIKCADISNVARVFPVAHQWANILTDEFANQGTMEEELGIPTCLFGGPPTPGDIIKLGESQIGFMSVFARPLFEGVASVLPAMSYTVDELERNRLLWEKRITDERSQPAFDNGNAVNCNSSTSRGSYTESNPTNENPTPHTSADVADLRSPSLSSSSNGQATVVSPQITATALPLQQIEENMAANDANAALRGRSTTTNGASINTGALSATSDSRLLPKSTGQSSEKQRAVSAHHTPRQQVDKSENLPNGLNPRFGASETDVRFLGNGGSTLRGTVKSNKKDLYLQTNGDDGSAPDRNGRIDRRLTQSFKRLWKRRWRPGTNIPNSKADETTGSSSQQSNVLPVESRHGSG